LFYEESVNGNFISHEYYSWLGLREHWSKDIHIKLSSISRILVAVGDETYSSFKDSLAKKPDNLLKLCRTKHQLVGIKISGHNGYDKRSHSVRFQNVMRYIFDSCQQVASLHLVNLTVENTLVAVAACPTVRDVHIEDHVIENEQAKLPVIS
jgi:hypothetical protein